MVTSEGIATRAIAPWCGGTRSTARSSGAGAFDPTSAAHGVRQNLAFEAAAVAPNGRHLFVGMENALVQDGPAATLAGGSYSRILRYSLASGRLDRQNVCDGSDRRVARSADRIRRERPRRAPAVQRSVHALDGALVLRRRAGDRNTIKLYSVAFPGADDVDGLDSLAAILGSVPAVVKTLLLDLRTLGIPLDNVEGDDRPTLPDGRRSLVLVSDNNFSPAGFTQFLLFALD